MKKRDLEENWPSWVVGYLAGPMTGMPALNKPAFTRAARDLRKRGYTIVNTFELEHNLRMATDMQYEDFLRLDIRYGLAPEPTNSIILLKGWLHSRGALAELHCAATMGYSAFFYDRPNLYRMDLP